MRITGGSLKGRLVEVPEGIIRPAMDRMRESVFSVLGDLSGLSFLDLFSGSGIIALEAASRGAAMIEAVEKDPKKRKILLKNVAMSPVFISCRFSAVELVIQRARVGFDRIFCDPPFPYRFRTTLLQILSASALVKDGTLVLLHRPKQEGRIDDFPSLRYQESREYGRSVVDFFKGCKQS
ncbi:RsmD family RNA methyltransferase [Breznakiellaceae bacterium SP9]